MQNLLFILIVFLVDSALSDNSFVDCVSTPEFRIRIPKDRHTDYQNQNMTRDTIVAMLDGFVTSSQNRLVVADPTSAEQDWIIYQCRSVFHEARPAFSILSSKKRYIDVLSDLKEFLRTGIYDRAATIRHPDVGLSQTLEEFESRMQFKRWPRILVKKSPIKNLKRVLYWAAPGYPELAIAQTLTANDSVRETEIILKRTDEPGWDFYAYDASGKRTSISKFVSKGGKEVLGPVPHTCMACHYDGANRIFQRLPLSYNGKYSLLDWMRRLME